MPHLICYDIASNALRARLAKKIIGTGYDRINKSVYLGSVGESAHRRLVQWLRTQMNQQAEAGDSLVILKVSAHYVSELLVLGTDLLDRDDLNGLKNSWYF